MRIHEFQAGEGAKLLELFQAVLPNFTDLADFSDQGPAVFLLDSHSFALGAYVDGTPAGLAWGSQMRSPNGGLTTYIHELDVREQWRRQGLATALMTAAFDLARRRGSTRF